MEEAEKCWVELRQMRDSRDGADVTCPRLVRGMVAGLGKEAAFPCCPREMPHGNVGGLFHGGG